MPKRLEDEEYFSEEVQYPTADSNAEAAYGPSVVIAALDEIDYLVANARSVPLSANIVLNKAEILDLVGQARDALPEDLVAADAVVADADAVLTRADTAADAAINEANAKANALLDDARARAEAILAEARDEATRRVERSEAEAAHTTSRARKEAEDLLADARGQADRLVAADSITEMAQSRAHDLMIQSRRESEKLRSGADDYVASTLDQTSQVLQDLLRRTEAGLRAIADRQSVAQTDIELDE